MLDAIKKALQGKAKVEEVTTEAVVEQAETEAAVEAVTEELVDNAELVAAKDLALMQAEHEMMLTVNGEQARKIEELSAKLEEATAALAAIAADAEAKRLAARKEKVEAAIGTEKAAGLLAATEGLDDAAFDAVVSALNGSVEVEAATDLFKEVGVTAEADAAKVVTESAEMKILRQKYQSK